MRKHELVFVPPDVRDAIYNIGLADLTFIVVTSPPEDADDPSLRSCVATAC